MAKVTYNVHFNNDGLQRELESLITDPVTRYEIHMAFARKIDPWVPYLTGDLSKLIEITPESVKYTQPYAAYQYYGVGFNHTRDTHPLASAMWDKVAMETQLDSFKAEVQDIMRRRLHG